MIDAEGYFSHDDFVSSRCYKSSQKVIYTNEYRDTEQALQRCIDKMKEIGRDEWQLLDDALHYKEKIMFMFEEYSYLQGFHDVLDIVSRGRLD